MSKGISTGPWWLGFWISLAIAGTTIDINAVMSAIQQVESGGKPFAILDNSTKKSYFLPDEATAVAKAKELVALQHSIDMGIRQINSIHLSRPGVTLDNIFTIAIQQTISAKIFNEFYVASKAKNGDTDLAVWRAVGAYNMGGRGLTVDNVAYTNKVQAHMGLSPRPSVGAEETAARTGGKVRDPWFKVTPKPLIPSEWAIGNEIDSLTPPGDQAEENDDDNFEGTLVALVFLVIVVLLAKFGLLWIVIKKGINWSAKKAAQAATKRRERDFSMN